MLAVIEQMPINNEFGFNPLDFHNPGSVLA